MNHTILIIDDEENARSNIGSFLSNKGYEVLEAGTLKDARKVIQIEQPDLILLDVQLPDGYGPSLLEEVVYLPSRPPVIVITAYGDIEMAVDAMRNGAHDFLQKPIKYDRLLQSLDRAGEIVQMRRELAHFRQQTLNENTFIAGNTIAMTKLLNQASRAAKRSVSVLITGETGTGKEVLATAIRQIGPRAKKPYMAINCAAIQPTMIESELFGYEAGAFTGATKRKHGLIEIAHEGILFLDEIASMPTDMQAKLLRVLEEREFRRVGGTKNIKVDVQLIAASNRNLMKMVQAGEFREDLFYRLKVVDLEIPPLRERREDIKSLVWHFIDKLNPQMGMNIEGITPKALDALKAHNWPGNIRELRNIIERAMLFCDDPEIDLQHLPSEFHEEHAPLLG